MIFDENVKKEIICNSNIAAIIAKPSDILFFRFFPPYTGYKDICHFLLQNFRLYLLKFH